jgi:hypothetical protein
MNRHFDLITELVHSGFLDAFLFAERHQRIREWRRTTFYSVFSCGMIVMPVRSCEPIGESSSVSRPLDPQLHSSLLLGLPDYREYTLTLTYKYANTVSLPLLRVCNAYYVINRMQNHE